MYKDCSNFDLPRRQKSRPIKHPLLLATLHAMVDIIRVELKLNRYVVVGTKLRLEASIIRR